ncbi:hypothetical protein FB451DRAFT_1408420 [Mycena latifolia]|nr:hypothetical protein FB451DRAFT_1408420 [Mycena latifolia]
MASVRARAAHCLRAARLERRAARAASSNRGTIDLVKLLCMMDTECLRSHLQASHFSLPCYLACAQLVLLSAEDPVPAASAPPVGHSDAAQMSLPNGLPRANESAPCATHLGPLSTRSGAPADDFTTLDDACCLLRASSTRNLPDISLAWAPAHTPPRSTARTLTCLMRAPRRHQRGPAGLAASLLPRR